ncbi:MAG: SCO family protein [Actinobacteria bacterium]|nr:SCO family protein [Actinomycetota bacterium]
MRRALAVAALLAVTASACSSQPPELAGYTRTPAPNTAGIALPDATAGGAPFTLAADPGGLLLVYFGYTSCPDVCPTTMADLRTALRALGDDASGVETAMVTVDPERDTDEVMAAYVRSFIDGAHGLRTEDPVLLADAAVELGAAYSVTEGEDGAIEVAHTAHVYVIDEHGDLLVTWPWGTEAPDMTSDLRILLSGR